jgi:predicted RNA-binding protein with PUA-like domain
MAQYLLKTEPSTYSFGDLQKARTTVWDGVTNPVALKNLRAAKLGDQLVIYHTGDEKAAVGLAEVTREAFPDPKGDDERLVVIEITARELLPKPVTLATLKSHAAFGDSPLVRQGRLSVVPLDDSQWQALLALSGR